MKRWHLSGRSLEFVLWLKQYFYIFILSLTPTTITAPQETKKIHHKYTNTYFCFGILLYVVKESSSLTYVIIKKINVTLIIDMETTTMVSYARRWSVEKFDGLLCYSLQKIFSFDRFICFFFSRYLVIWRNFTIIYIYRGRVSTRLYGDENIRT